MSSRLCPFCMKMTDADTCPHCGKDTDYAGMPLHLPAGFVVHGRHPYVLGAALGQGGFGITYIALDMVTNEQVAIKEYFPTYCAGRTADNMVISYPNQEEVFQKGKERFLDEARVLKSLSDLKSIVNVLDFFGFNNSAYLVMEFLEGDSLKSHAQKHGKFPAQAFLKQLRPLMEDIERMHQRGVVHRDIAPDNIILMSDGQMKLIDFGAARSYVGDKSMTVVVKKGFAPIEQYMRKGSSSYTDVYALAATIYYCITGVVPPDSAERQYDEEMLKSPISLGAELSKEQERAILKALEVQPKKRTQSVAELIKALEHAPKPEKPKPVKKTEKPKAEPRRKQKWMIPAVAAVLLCIVCSVLFLGKKSPAAPVESEPVQVAIPETTVPETEPAVQPSTENPIEVPFELERNTLDQFFLKKVNEQHEQIIGRQVDSWFSAYEEYRFSLVFVNSLNAVPNNAFDVSEACDKTVMAWFEPYNKNYKVFIAADGEIKAPQNCTMLFSSWKIESIDFNYSFSTENVFSMRAMFKTSHLTSIDLDCFDFSQVKDMSSMFMDCRYLESINFSDLDISHIENKESIFYNCWKLKTVDVNGKPWTGFSKYK